MKRGQSEALNMEKLSATSDLRLVPRIQGTLVVRILQQKFLADSGEYEWHDVPLRDENTGERITELDEWLAQHLSTTVSSGGAS